MRNKEQGTYTAVTINTKSTWLRNAFKIDKSALKMIPGITTGNHCFLKIANIKTDRVFVFWAHQLILLQLNAFLNDCVTSPC